MKDDLELPAMRVVLPDEVLAPDEATTFEAMHRFYTTDDWLEKVRDEVKSARALYPRRFVNAHEAHSIIEEEYDEFKREVFVKHRERNGARMRNELIQLAAMCIRALEDVDPHAP